MLKILYSHQWQHSDIAINHSIQAETGLAHFTTEVRLRGFIDINLKPKALDGDFVRRNCLVLDRLRANAVNVRRMTSVSDKKCALQRRTAPAPLVALVSS